MATRAFQDSCANIVYVGFLLWIVGDVAWAQGTYESRAIGSAVIAVTDLFQYRDFRPGRHTPDVSDPGYVGWFASLSDVNARLRPEAGRSVLPGSYGSPKASEPRRGNPPSS